MNRNRLIDLLFYCMSCEPCREIDDIFDILCDVYVGKVFVSDDFNENDVNRDRWGRFAKKFSSKEHSISSTGANDFYIEFSSDEKGEERGFYFHVEKHVFKESNLDFLFSPEERKELREKRKKRSFNSKRIMQDDFKKFGRVYEKAAQELIRKPVDGKNILGYALKSKPNIIVRYDKKRNLYVKGDFKTGKLITFFAPRDKMEYYNNRFEDEI